MLPVLFSIGPITFYSFGFCLAIGFFLAAFFIWRRLRELGLKEERVIDFIILATLFASVVSKVIMALEKQGFSGLVFWGEILAIELSLLWLAKKEKRSFWLLADEITFGLLPFFVLTKAGAFLDGSVIGKPTNMPWGMYFPGKLVRSQPLSLFFAVALLLIWLFLLRIERQWRIWPWYKSKKNGLIHLTFLGLVALANFLVAFWRLSGLYWFWGEIGLSGVVFLSAVVILYWRSGRTLREDLGFILSKGKNGQKEKGKK